MQVHITGILHVLHSCLSIATGLVSVLEQDTEPLPVLSLSFSLDKRLPAKCLTCYANVSYTPPHTHTGDLAGDRCGVVRPIAWQWSLQSLPYDSD